MTQRSILVTGGAGYIGSHVVLQLRERGERVIVLDDLSTGFREAVRDAPLIIGNAGDVALVKKILHEHDVDTVMHFAASISVPDSVRDPLAYYRNNTVNTRALLEACAAHGLTQFVFSSTAAVYGMPATGRAAESDPTAPINPYGRSKLMSEWMLRDVATATATATDNINAVNAKNPLRYVALRYFNVAGADHQLRIGQALKASFHLVHVAAEHVSGRRADIAMFGTDYDTADGTAIRDYLHVEDLARAHLDALAHLRAGRESTTLNVGYGHGYSVREVLDAVQRHSDRPLVIRTGPRRAGDPPVLVAEASRIRAELGWQPQYDDLDQIVRSAIEWEKKLRAHPWG
ncbi:MAG: UDP-glucose 4-epimerase GalE [Gammaproteobacteria bacterium]|nr:UDP-glucose 4-epimerase GalE [Gammaproteobacteria bacterium]